MAEEPKGDGNKIAEAVRRAIDRYGDVVQAAAWIGVRPSTLTKVLEGTSLSAPALKKLTRLLEVPETLRRAKPVQIDRLETAHRLYLELGTLQAVGDRMSLTRERVRQLLEKGAKLELFEYKPREYPFVERGKILAAYSRELNLSRAARDLGISRGYLEKLLTAYSIGAGTLRAIRRRTGKARRISDYRRLEVQLGRSPTTTDLQATSTGRSLHMKILRLWGSIDAFRDELSIPAPSKGSPTFREDTAAWREHQRRIAFVRRMQQLDDIRECLEGRGAQSTGAIVASTRLNANRVRFLMGLLVGAGEVINERTGSSSRYHLATAGRPI